MGGAEAAAGVGVEVLVEEDEVAPMGVGGVARVRAVARAVAGVVGLKEARQAAGELLPLACYRLRQNEARRLSFGLFPIHHKTRHSERRLNL